MNKIGNKNSPPLQHLWDKWLKNRDYEAGNGLIEHYLYLVTFHVERIAINLPNSVSKEDLKSFAYMGLYDALNKFEVDRNLKFDTYASFRIRGSIIDGLRKEDWLPRSLRDKTKQIDQMTEKLEQILQREPSSSEIAHELNISAEEVENINRDSLFANVLSIEQKPKDGTNEHKEGIGYNIPDDRMLPYDEQMVQNELNGEIVEGIKLLNKNEQLIISLFYTDELSMTEIGNILGLTTSRISQIHKKAIFKLRKSLTKIQINN